MKKHALLIGINEYSEDPLAGAVQDASEVAQTLKSLYGFIENEVTLLTCKQAGHFRPSRGNIRKHLLGVEKDLDILLVGFWGHGKILALPSGEHELYLCANDTDKNDLEESGIALNFLKNCLKKAKMADTCLILDCCQTVHGVRNSGTSLTQEAYDKIACSARDLLCVPRDVSDIRRNPTKAILNSCSFDQKAYEYQSDKGLTHGIFTFHLLEAMRQSGRFTDWASYVSREVPQTAWRQRGARQEPFMKIEGGGDIDFAATALPKPDKVAEVAEVARIRAEAEKEATQIIAEAKQQADTIRASMVSAASAPTNQKQSILRQAGGKRKTTGWLAEVRRFPRYGDLLLTVAIFFGLVSAFYFDCVIGTSTGLFIGFVAGFSIISQEPFQDFTGKTQALLTLIFSFVGMVSGAMIQRFQLLFF